MDNNNSEPSARTCADATPEQQEAEIIRLRRQVMALRAAVHVVAKQMRELALMVEARQ